MAPGKVIGAMDDTEVGDLDATRSLVLEALVHQSRQPLFVLQNYLFAVGQLAARNEGQQDGQQIQMCVTEMRSAIDGLRQCLARIAEMGAVGDVNLPPKSLAGFLEEVFQIVRFCARRHDVQVQWEIRAIPPEVLVKDPALLQLKLVQWILEACPDKTGVSADEEESVLNLTASHFSSGIVITLRRAALELEFEISSLVTSPNRLTAPLPN